MQEAIGVSWAAATAEAPTTNTSDSEDYLSMNDFPPIVSIGSSRRTRDKANDNALSTDTRKTYARRRRNSSSSTSISSLEDYQTPSPLFNTPEFQKPKLLVNSLGHKTTAPTNAQLRAAAARERWELDEERRVLQQLAQREDSLW